MQVLSLTVVGNAVILFFSLTANILHLWYMQLIPLLHLLGLELVMVFYLSLYSLSFSSYLQRCLKLRISSFVSWLPHYDSKGEPHVCPGPYSPSVWHGVLQGCPRITYSLYSEALCGISGTCLVIWGLQFDFCSCNAIFCPVFFILVCSLFLNPACLVK